MGNPMSLENEKMAIVEIVAELLSLEGVRNSRRLDYQIEELCDRLKLPSYRRFFYLFCSGVVEWFGFLDGFRLVPRQYRQYRPEFELARDRFFERSNQYDVRQRAIALADGESLGGDVYGVGIVGASLGAGEAGTRTTGRGLTVLSIDEIASVERLALPPPSYSRGSGFSGIGFSQGYREAAERARQIVSSTKSIACDGCTNYHGQSYGGNKLICAIHPAGVDGDRCGDWEGELETTL